MAEGKYLLFITRATGYQLAERDGEPPAAGTELELDDGETRYWVSKVAPSPLPGDDRVCAYLQQR